MAKNTPLFLLFLALYSAVLVAEPIATESTRRFNEPVFGGELVVDEYGRGNASKMLLVHGLGDIAASDWEKVASRLSSQYHLIIPDLPGFGRSSKGNKHYSIEAYAELLHWLIRQYGKEPIVLVGHSLGGAIAIQLAAEQPNAVQQLIVIDAAGILHRSLITRHAARVSDKGIFRKLAKPAIKGFNAITRGVINALELEETPEELQRILHKPDLRQQYLNGEPGRIAGVSLVTADFSQVLPKVRAPSLIIWGSDDPVAPLRTAKMLAGNLPQAQLVVLPYAGHGPINTQPRKTASAILDYLQQPRPIQRGAIDNSSSRRTGECIGNSGTTFKGHYDTISIRGCKKIVIENATVQSIAIRSSNVTIRNSIIAGADTAIKIVGGNLFIENSNISGINTGLYAWSANVTISGAQLQSNIALHNKRSRLDLAGVSLTGKEAALKNIHGRATVMFSASRAHSNNGQHYLHGITKIHRKQPL